MKEHRISLRHDIYQALLDLAAQVQRERAKKGDYSRVHPAEMLDDILRGIRPPLVLELAELPESGTLGESSPGVISLGV